MSTPKVVVGQYMWPTNQEYHPYGRSGKRTIYEVLQLSDRNTAQLLNLNTGKCMWKAVNEIVANVERGIWESPQTSVIKGKPTGVEYVYGREADIQQRLKYRAQDRCHGRSLPKVQLVQVFTDCILVQYPDSKQFDLKEHTPEMLVLESDLQLKVFVEIEICTTATHTYPQMVTLVIEEGEDIEKAAKAQVKKMNDTSADYHRGGRTKYKLEKVRECPNAYCDGS